MMNREELHGRLYVAAGKIRDLESIVQELEQNQYRLLEAWEDARTLAIYYKQKRRPPDSMWQKLQKHEHFVKQLRKGEQ